MLAMTTKEVAEKLNEIDSSFGSVRQMKTFADKNKDQLEENCFNGSLPPLQEHVDKIQKM